MIATDNISPSARVKTIALALCVVSFLAACSRAPDEMAPKTSPEPRDEAKTEAFSIVAEFSAKDTVAAESDKRVLRWQDSPCEDSPVVKTASMLLDDPILQPDFVVEFEANGRVLRTWGKPFNSEVGVLRGDRISFTHAEDDEMRTYWTDTAGRIAPGDATASAHPHIDESAPVDCPKIELFGDSAYLQCFEAIDAGNSQTRRIALEGPCT